MRAFRSLTARAAVLDRPNVDTDQIIPKQFLKRIERTGFGEFLFYDWRQEPDFELNRPEYDGAKILLTGANFGCGSSREHAAWSLQDYGFDVVVAPSFSDIFLTNSVQIGLVPAIVPAGEMRQLMDGVVDGGELTVDLEEQRIVDAHGNAVRFEIEPHARDALLRGLDPIGSTLLHAEEIATFEERSPSPVATTALGA